MDLQLDPDLQAGVDALAGVPVGDVVTVYRVHVGTPPDSTVPNVIVQQRLAKRTKVGVVLQPNTDRWQSREVLSLLHAARFGWRLTEAAARAAAVAGVKIQVERCQLALEEFMRELAALVPSDV